MRQAAALHEWPCLSLSNSHTMSGASVVSVSTTRRPYDVSGNYYDARDRAVICVRATNASHARERSDNLVSQQPAGRYLTWPSRRSLLFSMQEYSISSQSFRRVKVRTFFHGLV